jgi:hypothetical protein
LTQKSIYPRLDDITPYTLQLIDLHTTNTMSDFEDEMDVDGPAPSKDVTFSSEASKGKRSAANLPVEAEDSLPW